MRPIVVFMVDSLQNGGAEQSLLEIVKGLRFFDPVLVVPFKGRMDLQLAYEGAGIRVLRLDLKRSFNFRKLADKAYPEIRKLKPALIHSTLFYSDMLARRLRPMLGIPLVNSVVNDTYGWRRYRIEPWHIKFKLFALHVYDAWTASSVDRFISNSHTIAATLSKALIVSPGRISVIPRGRSVAAFQNEMAAAANELRTSLRLLNKTVFLHVGRMIRRKGHSDLLNAFAKLSSAHAEVVLLLAGHGPEYKQLSELAAGLGLGERVLFLGDRKDVPALMKASDYFVFPSYYEGLPGVLVEAMLSCLPVIASDNPENRECLDSSMALFFPAGNVNELTARMEEALQDTCWQGRTEAAYMRAVTQFSPEKISAAYEAVYRELTGVTV